MNMILTSECEGCGYGIINDENPAEIKVFCKDRNKEYYYGQCIPCDNKTKKRAKNDASEDREIKR